MPEANGNRTGWRSASNSRLRVCAIALLATVGFAASSAATTVTFDSTFVSSTSGTNSIGIGDSISFEQWITIDAGVQVSSVALVVTGDLTGALSTPNPFCSDDSGCGYNAAGQVTGWAYADAPGARSLNVGVSRVSGPMDELWLEGPGRPGFALGNATHLPFINLFKTNGITRYDGNGIRSLMGTVTVTANQTGSFESGAVVKSGIVGAFGFSAGSGFEPDEYPDLSTAVNGGSYIVHAPEPGTAVLTAMGLAGIAAFGRRRSTPN